MPGESSLTVQQVTLAGVEITFDSANADGNYFINNGKTILIVTNGGESPINVIVDSPVKCNQGYDHDETVAVEAGKTKHIGPFEYLRFSPAGAVHITYSDVTSVTVAVIST